MKKRFLQVILVILLGLTGLVSYQWWAWWTGPRNKITQETVGQIQHGMKLEHVKAIIGGAPGYYQRPAFIRTAYHFRFSDPATNTQSFWWVSDVGQIEVSIKDGVVTEAHYALLP